MNSYHVACLVLNGRSENKAPKHSRFVRDSSARSRADVREEPTARISCSVCKTWQAYIILTGLYYYLFILHTHCWIIRETWAHKGIDTAPRIPDFVYELSFFFFKCETEFWEYIPSNEEDLGNSSPFDESWIRFSILITHQTMLAINEHKKTRFSYCYEALLVHRINIYHYLLKENTYSQCMVLMLSQLLHLDNINGFGNISIFFCCFVVGHRRLPHSDIKVQGRAKASESKTNTKR